VFYFPCFLTLLYFLSRHNICNWYTYNRANLSKCPITGHQLTNTFCLDLHKTFVTTPLLIGTFIFDFRLQLPPRKNIENREVQRPKRLLDGPSPWSSHTSYFQRSRTMIAKYSPTLSSWNHRLDNCASGMFCKLPLYPRERAPGTHFIGGWVDPRAGLDDMEK
jgi:hypothetical protein